MDPLLCDIQTRAESGRGVPGGAIRKTALPHTIARLDAVTASNRFVFASIRSDLTDSEA